MKKKLLVPLQILTIWQNYSFLTVFDIFFIKLTGLLLDQLLLIQLTIQLTSDQKLSHPSNDLFSIVLQQLDNEITI